jgi:hypothetical protein
MTLLLRLLWVWWTVAVLLVSRVRGNACDDTGCVFFSGGCTRPELCQEVSAQNPRGSTG